MTTLFTDNFGLLIALTVAMQNYKNVQFMVICRCWHTDTVLGLLWKHHGVNELCQVNGRPTVEKWKFMEPSGTFCTEFTFL